MLPKAIAIVRILIGSTVLAMGIIWLTDPTFLYGGLMLELAEHGRPYAFYDRYVLGRYVLMHQEFFGYVLAIGEILVGVSFLTGALVSLGALGGALSRLWWNSRPARRRSRQPSSCWPLVPGVGWRAAPAGGTCDIQSGSRLLV